jgi:hypothetical protein
VREPFQRKRAYEHQDHADDDEGVGHMASEIADAARETAGRLGINPSDLLTAISFETGGRMSPSLRGGKDNSMLGLINAP